MKFSIQINCSPYNVNVGQKAYRFILAAIAKDHQILRVFFYREGIYHALRWALPPDDEFQFSKRWSELATIHGVDLVVCISAAQRRGLLCLEEAVRQGKKDDDLAEGFRIGGLGQLIESTLEADRFIVFS